MKLSPYLDFLSISIYCTIIKTKLTFLLGKWENYEIKTW
ncbi:protein of unknown function [Streptococcus thermophilus]|nr:protein of unknown function [Streptococcus thermophilus]CAD0126860.1 protein of unknown function [Streptococcus thermophilus]CAD0127333.1 protein of unknown function [Streptococcus thermophilus]CAD0134544.1 protein of unknown function [Streptococcus thermophilus]CAD0137698.1 protein of unknown function [Streptococcus thermophilus]